MPNLKCNFYPSWLLKARVLYLRYYHRVIHRYPLFLWPLLCLYRINNNSWPIDCYWYYTVKCYFGERYISRTWNSRARTVLFVNWVICGMSALSLHADSIVRSPFVFRVILHWDTGATNSRIYSGYVNISTFFNRKTDRFLKKWIMVMLENLHTRTNFAGWHGHCLQIPNTGDCAPKHILLFLFFLFCHYNVLETYLHTNTSVMRILLTSLLSLLINIAVIRFVRFFIFLGQDV